jgi:hypothetical protein
VDSPSGLTVRFSGQTEFRSLDVGPLMEFAVAVSAGVTAKLVADWIVAKFRGRTTGITINRRVIDLDDEGQVRRIVEEEIKERRT